MRPGKFFQLLTLLTFPAVLFLLAVTEGCRQDTKSNPAPKPLFRDPVYDGAADPVVVWNKEKEMWFMFYTNRRANAEGLDGVTWVHGTHIGIAESQRGVNWTYLDTCNIGYRNAEYSHWAPEVIEHAGLYHMYLTYVPGIFGDWRHPRNIIHLTSKNLVDWDYESILSLANDKVIDACVFRMPDGTWRMWYNNEKDGKSIYFADSPDLYTWEDRGKAVGDQGGEGPKVFKWKGKYWMITDVWQGLAVYESEDLDSWKRVPGNLLEHPGKGTDDGVKGGHPDVLVNEDHAYLFYFTHPGRVDTIPDSEKYQKRRSSIQVTELEYLDGKIVCDRNKQVYIDLKPQQ